MKVSEDQVRRLAIRCGLTLKKARNGRYRLVGHDLTNTTSPGPLPLREVKTWLEKTCEK